MSYSAELALLGHMNGKEDLHPETPGVGQHFDQLVGQVRSVFPDMKLGEIVARTTAVQCVAAVDEDRAAFEETIRTGTRIIMVNRVPASNAQQSGEGGPIINLHAHDVRRIQGVTQTFFSIDASPFIPSEAQTLGGYLDVSGYNGMSLLRENDGTLQRLNSVSNGKKNVLAVVTDSKPDNPNIVTAQVRAFEMFDGWENTLFDEDGNIVLNQEIADIIEKEFAEDKIRFIKDLVSEFPLREGSNIRYALNGSERVSIVADEHEVKIMLQAQGGENNLASVLQDDEITDEILERALAKSSKSKADNYQITVKVDQDGKLHFSIVHAQYNPQTRLHQAPLSVNITEDAFFKILDKLEVPNTLKEEMDKEGEKEKKKD